MVWIGIIKVNIADHCFHWYRIIQENTKLKRTGTFLIKKNIPNKLSIELQKKSSVNKVTRRNNFQIIQTVCCIPQHKPAN